MKSKDELTAENGTGPKFVRKPTDAKPDEADVPNEMATPEDEERRSAALAPHRDKRLTVEFYVDRFNTVSRDNHHVRCCLVQDTVLHADGAVVDVGHLWVQHAGTLQAAKALPGDRVRCTCRVIAYKKRLATVRPGEYTTVVTRYGLAHPQNVEVISRGAIVAPAPAPAELGPPPATTAAPPPPPVPAPSPPPDRIALLTKIKALAEECGGVDKLIKMARALKTVLE